MKVARGVWLRLVTKVSMRNFLQLRKWWLPALCSLVMMPFGVAAEEPARPKPLKITLLSEVSHFQAGEAFTVGLLLQHQPHHHSYYKFPGIVGVPTCIEWELPEGFKAGPLKWPTPEQVDMRGHGAYGYHDDTVLLATITPPKTFANETVRLGGRVGYMCCSQERCTPGFEDVLIDLASNKEVRWDPKTKLLFAKARKALPEREHAWKARVEESEGHFSMTVTPPSTVEPEQLPKASDLYFYSWNGWTASNKPHQCEWIPKEGSYRLVMPKHPFPDDEEAKGFEGVLKSASGWPGLDADGLWITVKRP